MADTIESPVYMKSRANYLKLRSGAAMDKLIECFSKLSRREMRELETGPQRLDPFRTMDDHPFKDD